MFVIGSLSTHNAISWSSLKLLTVINPTVQAKESRDTFEHETTYKRIFQLVVFREGYTNTHTNTQMQIIDCENWMPIPADISKPNPYNCYFDENQIYCTHTI